MIVWLAIVSSACQHATKNPAQLKSKHTKLAILSINDVYRIGGIDNGQTGGLARVRALRKQLEEQYEHVLFLHAGDFLHPSFLSKQDNGLAMIQTLNVMDGQSNAFDNNMLVTWGNHEFDKGRMKHVPLMNDLVDQSEFIWLGSNIQWQPDSIRSARMKNHLMLSYGGIKVGVFSHTTDIAHPEYIDSFGDFAATAERYVPMLRDLGADFVIALTHQWLQDDLAMMKLPADVRPDIIFGGHEHYVQTEQANGNWVLKADADAASAIVAEISFKDGTTQVFPQIVQLDQAFPEDPSALALITELQQSNDEQYCQQQGLPADCLTEVLGYTNNQLVAEETEIRRFETNLGNELADLVLNKFAGCGANLALLNSGSIRLNQNIPAQSGVTVKHLEEMFPYPSDLRLIEFDGQLLDQILAHSISSWTANGHWLQVAGLAFIHDPEAQTASHIHLKGHAQPHDYQQQRLRAVVPYYLISDDTDHDGYSMINERMQVACDANGAQLKHMFTEHIKSQADGLNAQRDFRICNTTRDTCH